MKNTIFKDVSSHIQAPRDNAQFSGAPGVANNVADKRYPGQDSLFCVQVIVYSPISNLSQVKFYLFSVNSSCLMTSHLDHTPLLFII